MKLQFGNSPARRTLFLVGTFTAVVAITTPSSRRSPQAADEAKSDDSAWHLVPIPESWKRQPGGELATKDGFAWYRAVVKIPAGWKDKQVRLLVEPVDDARQVYFNGAKVGVSGTFPPQFRSGLGEKGRYELPADSIRYGEFNEVAVRTFNSDGRENFLVAAPTVYVDGEGVKMEGRWQYRPGDDEKWATGLPTNGKENEAVFTTVDKIDDLKLYLKRRKGDRDPLTPEEALAAMQVPDDLVIEQPLADPDVLQPLFMNWDERGRLWVLEYLQYPEPAGLKMVSRDKHLRTVYDKVPLPPPFGDRGKDRISIHEDTTGDGKYDKHTIFVDGLNISTSFARGRGGVWVLNPPYLLFYPDLNNDDVPDSDPIVHLEGFGIEDSHSVVNSLRWGPDGWLYAAQGSTVTANLIRTGIDKQPRQSLGQLIWRYHPETRTYEVFAEGGGNTFGVEIDSKGRVYSGHNGGDTRGFHYVQGGYFQKGFGKHGALSNPYTFGYFPDMEHPSVPRFTHNFVIYEADALPESYRGRLFGIEPLQGQVVMSDVSPHGSTYRTKDLSRPIKTDDQWFRPVDIKVGPDGGIYVADMYEQRIDHSSHYAGRIDRDSGRIYRLRGKNAPHVDPFDYGKLSTAELVQVLAHPIKWHRQQALRLIADRRDESVVPFLKKFVADEEGQIALEHLWALNLSGGFDEPTALELLDHADPFVRLWTVRLACDDRRVSDALAENIARKAKHESYVQVRSQMACSARRLSAEHALPIVRNLLEHEEDVDDPHVPLLLWWAIEDKAASNRDAVLALFSDPAVWRLPLVEKTITERLMRRYAMAGARRDLLTCAKLLNLAPGEKEQKQLMAGFEAAYQGRSPANLPDELVDAIAKSGGGSPVLRLRQGDQEMVAEALKTIVDSKADRKQRLDFILVFGQVKQPESVPALLKVVETSKDAEVQRAALTALQSYSDDAIGTEIVRLHNGLADADVRESAQALLTSRKPWAREFLTAIDAGRIKPDDVPTPIVRKLLLHDDPQIAATVKKHFGDVGGATTAEMRAQVDRLTEVVNVGSGNPYQGKALFGKTCGKCHKLFQAGGDIGPDLTSFKRDDLPRLLLNVVNPSAEIREGFENYMVVTADGRVVNGFLADQDNRVVILRGVDGRNIVIPRDDVDDMRAINRSVMPDGALKDLSDQQIRNLFAYLRASQPLP